MTITVRWDDVMDQVLYVTYRGRWTWDEYETAATEVQAMIDSVPGRVDALVDTLSNVVALPPDFGRLAGSAVEDLDPRLKLIVVVGNDINREILRALSVNYSTIQQSHIFAPTLDEGRALIAASRAQDNPPMARYVNGGPH